MFKQNVSYNHYLLEWFEMVRFSFASWTLMILTLGVWFCINIVCSSTPSQFRPAEIHVTGTRKEKNSHSSHSCLVTILNSLKSFSCQKRVYLKSIWADTCKCVKVSWWCLSCSTCTCVYTGMYIPIYVCVYLYIYIYMHLYTCVYTCVYMYVLYVSF